MKKHYPKTLMTLALGALIATGGMTSANATVGLETYEIQTTEAKQEMAQKASTTPLKPGVTIPLIKQTSIIDRLSSVTSYGVITVDPSVKLSFERPTVKTMPDPAIAAKKKADEEARIAAEKAAEAKAAAEKTAKEVAEKAANEAAKIEATYGAGASQTSAPTATGTKSAPAPTVKLPQNLTAYQQYAAKAMSARGLNGTAELTCLIPLWNHESGWNPNAANPTSTARGIPQMMMNIHYGANWQTSAAGVAYLTNPEVQIDRGLDYILGRYGTPCNAWSTWQSQSWY